jgi:phosphoribosylamine--glycine ligase
MKVLVIGSGGREHALATWLADEGNDVLVAPGNGGTPRSVMIQPTDVDALIDLVRAQRIELSVVGPEAPLASGIVDRFNEHGLAVFGPTRSAARLEWSKAWTKTFLQEHGIPTGVAAVVDSESAARRALTRMGLPAVLKADGLAGGKGVFVVTTDAQADTALDELFVGRTLGPAADQVLVEECLEGPELSVLAFADGEHLAVMPPARDYKRLLDGDRGPNTGGMGGYTRPRYVTQSLLDRVEQTILRPTLTGMLAAGHPYRGVLYAGLMLTADGPKVLEFNCRFGDPECQLILPLMASRLSDACGAVTAGCLRASDVRWKEGRTFGVVLAAADYPVAPRTGDAVTRLAEITDDVRVFHAGTRLDSEGRLVTAGGRVLTLVGSERAAVYRAAETVSFTGKHFRRDIGVEVETRRPVGATE